MNCSTQELKARNVQHARNLFDRAVTLLPRIDQLWYKYVYLEELLQNVPGARQVFERWMKWQPEDKAWQAYIKMEERYSELDRASAIYERWVGVRPDPRVWVKWAKFEEERGQLGAVSISLYHIRVDLHSGLRQVSRSFPDGPGIFWR